MNRILRLLQTIVPDGCANPWTGLMLERSEGVQRDAPSGLTNSTALTRENNRYLSIR